MRPDDRCSSIFIFVRTHGSAALSSVGQILPVSVFGNLEQN